MGSSGNYILTPQEALGGAWEGEQEKHIPRLTFVGVDFFIPQTVVGWAMDFLCLPFPNFNCQELICCSNLEISPIEVSPCLQSLLNLLFYIFT